VLDGGKSSDGPVRSRWTLERLSTAGPSEVGYHVWCADLSPRSLWPSIRGDEAGLRKLGFRDIRGPDPGLRFGRRSCRFCLVVRLPHHRCLGCLRAPPAVVTTGGRLSADSFCTRLWRWDSRRTIRSFPAQHWRGIACTGAGTARLQAMQSRSGRFAVLAPARRLRGRQCVLPFNTSGGGRTASHGMGLSICPATLLG